MKKLLSVLLAVCMVVTMVSAVSFTAAAECEHTSTYSSPTTSMTHHVVCSDCRELVGEHANGSEPGVCTLCDCPHDSVYYFEFSWNPGTCWKACNNCQSILGSHPVGEDLSCPRCYCQHVNTTTTVGPEGTHATACKDCHLLLETHDRGTSDTCVMCTCAHENTYVYSANGLCTVICIDCHDAISEHEFGTDENCVKCTCDHVLHWVNDVKNGDHYQSCDCHDVFGDWHMSEDCAPGCSFYVEPGMPWEEYLEQVSALEPVVISKARNEAENQPGEDKNDEEQAVEELTFTAVGEIYVGQVYLNELVDDDASFAIKRYVEMEAEDTVVDGNTVTLTEKLLESLEEGRYLLTVTSRMGCQFFLIVK